MKSLIKKEVPCDGSELVFEWKPSNYFEDQEIEYQNFSDKSPDNDFYENGGSSSIVYGSLSTVKEENNDNFNFLSSSLVAQQFIQNRMLSSQIAPKEDPLEQIIEKRHPLSSVHNNFQPKILIVDDEQFNRQSLFILLKISGI